MIKEAKALSLAEAQEYINKDDSEMKKFIKNFKPLTVEKAKELRTKLETLDLIKLNEKHISKIIDLFPETKEDLSKILSDINFSEDETNKILSTIKEQK